MLLTEWSYEQRKKRLWIPALIVFAVCAVYAGILSTRGMPPTEGWYSHYAYLMNEEGAVPYRDFELLFPPLYAYLIAFFCRIFGYEIIALRILGVIIYALTGLFAYLIFEKLTGKPIFAALAGLLTVSILQSEIVQIFYDYIRFMDLAIYASIYFWLVALVKLRKVGKVHFLEPSVLLGAFFAVLASMFKQSSGLIFLLYCLIFLLFAFLVFPKRNQYLKMMGASLIVIALCYGVMVLGLRSQGALEQYLYYNFNAAVSAKGGSLLMVLFGWLIRADLSIWLILLGLVGVLALGGLFFGLYKLKERYPADKSESVLPLKTQIIIGTAAFLVLLTVASILYSPLNVLWFGNQKKFATFLVATVCFATISILAIVRRIQKKEPPEGAETLCFFSGCVFIIAFAVCTSGGLADSQIALGYGFFAMLILSLLKFKKSQWVALGLAVLMLFNTGLGFERKIRTMYAWWGLDTGSLAEQTEVADVPYLSHIKMSKRYARMYEGVYQSVQERSGEEEGIFVFPHMPVLYLLCDRPQATNMANVWFDVTTDAGVIADIDVIREKKPRVIVACMIDDYVINSHEKSFRQGEESGLHQMQDFLIEFIEEEEYVCDGSYTVSKGYTIEVWYLPQ